MLRTQALNLLREVGCSDEVLSHCLAVERKAMELAKHIRANGHRVDLRLVRLGALLHDIGRSLTHDIKHGIIGAELLRKRGFGELAKFAERHIGAGIPSCEAKELGLGEQDFLPETLEEKLVAYADKLVVGSKSIPYELARRQLEAQLGDGHPALKRLDALHEEMEGLLGRPRA